MSTPQERREIYSSRRWQKLRSAKLDENPLCERCQVQGFINGAVMVHHVVPIRNGGEPFPELDGLMSLCWPCHQANHGGEPREKVDPVDMMSDERKKMLVAYQGLD